MESKFYEFSQNNTGGSFDVDSKLCHRLIIEADSIEEAVSRAEQLGCYWDGVEKGMDCDCCGDRWYQAYSEIDLDKINAKANGWEINKYVDYNQESEEVLAKTVDLYHGFSWIAEPKLAQKLGSTFITGRLRIDTVEQYAQMLANEYGWTTPDCRIFYKSGEVLEIFSPKRVISE